MRRHPPAEAEIIYNAGLATQKNELEHSMRHCWPKRSELAMIGGIAMKNKRIVIPFLLQKQILKQLHCNHMGIEEKGLLVCELVYWVNINADIEKNVKQGATCMEYQETQPCEKTVPYKLPYKPWEVVLTYSILIIICYYVL